MSARGEVRYKLSVDSHEFESGFQRAGKLMDQTASRTEQLAGKYGKMASAVEQTTQTLARSAGVFGLNEKGIRAMNDASEIAALGLNNLKGTAIGFNAATLGAVGAVASLAYGLGTLLRQWKPLADGADSAVAALRRLFTAQKDLDRQALGNMSQADWLKGTGFSGKSVALEMKAQEDAVKKSLQTAKDAKQAITEHLNFTEKVTRGVEASIDALFDAKSAAFQAQAALADGFVPETLLTPMRRGPDLSRVMGGVANGSITPGAPAAARGPGAFGAAFADLPSVLLGALQGGGGIGKSLGGLFGGALGTKLLSGGIGKMLGGVLGSALPGVGTLLGGLAGGLLGKVGGLFGFGGPSKEEKEAERKKAEQEKQRIQTAARSMRSSGISGLMEAGGSFNFQADAAHHGTIFAAAWSQVVKEKGIDAAAEAFGGAFDKLKEDFASKGLEMPAWMQAISGQMGLGQSEAFRGVAGNARTGASFLKSFGESGGLTPDVLKAFEQEARTAFAGGKGAAEGLGQGSEEATKAGFAAANPLLKELLNQSVVSGTTLSADIQAMADAAGVVPDVEFQQLDELRAIRAAVGALAGFTGGGGGSDGAVNTDIFRDMPQLAGGGRVSPNRGGGKGVPVVIGDGGGGETVVPDSQAGKWAQAVLAGSGGGGAAAIIAAAAAQPSIRVDMPTTINVALPPGMTAGQAQSVVGQIEDALAENRSAIPRLLVKAGFVRR